ncbi:interferon-related developmental regulator 1-like [Saccoglossus kowalevskii]|uniref:Interferon-related developmental regulator 1-like n=1 Tax=Saccoglossus kowalevskii TaxID=10224 RepID=A0ABM0H1H9_SACKO|nr:PREDICTED: interferon-related developmental regulator 1-like [Saccoglossus kowalevskii]
MPRTRNKKKGGRRSADVSEDETFDDRVSVASSKLSDHDSLPQLEDGDEGSDDVVEAGDEFEDKLKEFIDGTSQKSAKGRLTCLEGIRSSLSRRYIYEFIYERKITIADCIERCLKKGKSEEQSLAAVNSILLCCQLGAGEESEAIFNSFRPILTTIIQDKNASAKSRASCSTALGLSCFIASGDMLAVKEIMSVLELVFKASYLKGDGSSPSHSPNESAIHTSALSAWTLLLSISPITHVQSLISSHLPKILELLRSEDVNLRIAAGEAIALFYELAREQDELFVGEDIDSLKITLKELATDSNKYRAKKDRRQQRSSFRDILRTVEDNDYPYELIKFGMEAVELDSWVKKRQYGALRDVLGAGMNLHLRDNDLLREIFGLGASLSLAECKAMKLSKFERHAYNSAAFKARTLSRGKQRDTKQVAAY